MRARPEKEITGMEFSGSLTIAILLQGLVILMTMMIMDFGQILQIAVMSSVGFWVSVLVLLARKRVKKKVLTSFDMMYIQYGIILCWIAGHQLIMLIWKLRGVA